MSEKTAEIIGRWLDRAEAVLLWTIAAGLWVGVYFAAYFVVILMEEAKSSSTAACARSAGGGSSER